MKKPVRSPDVEEAEKKNNALRKGRLPQMVDWFDPAVLAMVGIRDLISATIGDYADQRPMQAAADNVGDDVLAAQNDYREVWFGGRGAVMGPAGRWSVPSKDAATGKDTTKHLTFDADGALWVDFIADLGDGFEATYAMAYLLAQPSLKQIAVSHKIANRMNSSPPLSSPLSLPAGDILIFGGDLAYPSPTLTEYNGRCIDPYNAAFRLPEGQTALRKLFFIAGNHDWYDGLAAFTSVFCAARNREGRGKTIGGWECRQHRSYFALALPHGWWFWGVDLALNVSIDQGQANYFKLMGERTRRGDRIVIIVHEPVWQTRDDSPLHDVTRWARVNGAEVVALLAGDLHFYSHYQSNDPKFQLIVSGGGGAFCHPTHQLPRHRLVLWTRHKEPARPQENGKAGAPDSGPGESDMEPPRALSFQEATVYPSKTRSRLVSLRNLWMPFHNKRFALFLGLIYFFYAWVFQVATADPSKLSERARAVRIEQDCSAKHPYLRNDPLGVTEDGFWCKPDPDQTQTEPENTAAKESASAQLDVAPKSLEITAGQDGINQIKVSVAGKNDLINGFTNEHPLTRFGEAGRDGIVFQSQNPNVVFVDPDGIAYAFESGSTDIQVCRFTAEELKAYYAKQDKRDVDARFRTARGELEIPPCVDRHLVGIVKYTVDKDWKPKNPSPREDSFFGLFYHPPTNAYALDFRGNVYAAEQKAWLIEAERAGSAGLLASVLGPPAGPRRLLEAMLLSPLFFLMIVALFLGLIYYVDANFKKWRWLNWPLRIVLGVPHAMGHIAILLITNFLLFDIYLQAEAEPRLLPAFLWIILYTVLTIVIGGTIGGMLWGLYWVLTSLIGGMHIDAFSALGVKGYKNFLRMRITEDSLTIYPIGLEKIPGRKGWRPLKEGEDMPGPCSLLYPKKQLKPHLIEAPIVIRRSESATMT
jgi:hypothetical protein